MANKENMMLSYPYDEKRAKFPGYISRKYDGVPGGYTNQCLLSRQAKRLSGVQWIHDLIHEYIPVGIQLWGEHYEPCRDFAYINGKTKQHKPWQEAHVMFFNLFDMFNPHATFTDRQLKMSSIVQRIRNTLRRDGYGGIANRLHIVEQVPVASAEDIPALCGALRGYAKHHNPKDNFEGCMYHSAEGTYVLDRSYNSMKLVDNVVYDLEFVNCDEAVSKTGVPLGRAGKLYFKDATGEEFGCGPGKLKHTEAKDVFENMGKFIGKIATVQAKPGGGYEKLRQPTFQHWRDDKTEPDTVNGGK